MFEAFEPFGNVWKILRGSTRGTAAITSFVRYVEQKLGAEFVYPISRFPGGHVELADLFELGEKLRVAGVIQRCTRINSPPDVPRLFQWHTRYRDHAHESYAVGCSFDDERAALTRMLAEALERHIWFERDDYFDSPTFATAEEIARHGPALVPERFAGFSPSQRKEKARLILLPTQKYRWIRGHSLTHNTLVWVPAQVVSAHAKVTSDVRKQHEPIIRHTITTGLATHSERIPALLAGAHEVIERDAFMIMWLNQLTLPCIEYEPLLENDTALERLMRRVEQYRFRPHVVRLITDAPTYALCVILEDLSGNAPLFSFGLRAHRSVARAIEGAVLEALRAQRGVQKNIAEKTVPQPGEAKKTIGHYDRLYYWAQKVNSEKLHFLIEGPHVLPTKEPWEDDTPSEHLDRIIVWCRERGYGLASVPFTRSHANIPRWHIEMVVIPELEPLYYREELPYTGGTRVSDIPRMFGFAPRSEPFLTEPHPFA